MPYNPYNHLCIHSIHLFITEPTSIISKSGLIFTCSDIEKNEAVDGLELIMSMFLDCFVLIFFFFQSSTQAKNFNK